MLRSPRDAIALGAQGRRIDTRSPSRRGAARGPRHRHVACPHYASAPRAHESRLAGRYAHQFAKKLFRLPRTTPRARLAITRSRSARLDIRVTWHVSSSAHRVGKSTAPIYRSTPRTPPHMRLLFVWSRLRCRSFRLAFAARLLAVVRSRAYTRLAPSPRQLAYFMTRRRSLPTTMQAGSGAWGRTSTGGSRPPSWY